jgi:hypothetical protein
MTKQERRAIVDKLGALDAEIAELKTKESEASTLRSEMRSWCVLTPAGEEEIYGGARFTAVIGPQANERTIQSIEKVFTHVGQAPFLKSCSLTLKSLKEIVTPDDFELFTSQARTGTRPVKTFAKATK